MRLLVKNTLFSLGVPGLGAVVLPWWVLDWRLPQPVVWPALVLIAAGLGLYLVCERAFAAAGRGTPGPWDPPRALVVVGPYRWVRNPIYLAAITVVLGEALLFASLALVEYAVVMALVVHLFVTAYEERKLRRSFGDQYLAYTSQVNRWLPRRPARR